MLSLARESGDVKQSLTAGRVRTARHALGSRNSRGSWRGRLGCHN